MIPPGGSEEITIPVGSLPLNNTGDEVRLLDERDEEVHAVTYERKDVASGRPILFPAP